MRAENSTSPGASKEEKVDDIETFYHSRDDLLAFACYRRRRILPRVKERLPLPTLYPVLQMIAKVGRKADKFLTLK
jgi:hypothetical protein